MAIFQSLLIIGYFKERSSEIFRIAIGFVLMGISLASLGMAKNFSTAIGLVGALALGMAMIAPNLSALISKRAGSANTGAALGVQSVANSLGQFVGPVLGGVLFGWNAGMPFLLTGALLVLAGMVVWTSGSAPFSAALERPIRKQDAG
jgi:DHA1 family multidrug resistance protein-like MFS transporter